MASLSAGDTVNGTNTTKSTTNGELAAIVKGYKAPRAQGTRKRRRVEPWATSAEIPEKAQRREELPRGPEAYLLSVDACQDSTGSERKDLEDGPDVARNGASNFLEERLRETEIQEAETAKDPWAGDSRRRRQDGGAHREAGPRRPREPVRDEATRLRKTIQWLEEGARRLREDLASARTELHEERRARKMARRESEAALREVRAAEAGKYRPIVAELKARLSRALSQSDTVRSTLSASPTTLPKVELIKEENHRREISALKKRLAEAESTARRLRWECLNSQARTSCKSGGPSCAEVRRLECEARTLRASNERLEDKLRIALEAEKARTSELRAQHERHEAELSLLRKSLRIETIKMMDELRGKSRVIEKLSKLAQVDASTRKRRKTATGTAAATTTTTTMTTRTTATTRRSMKDDATTRKLRDKERSAALRSVSRAEKKYLVEDGQTVEEPYAPEGGCEGGCEGCCEGPMTEDEVERLRELALEQREAIEILRQAVKEKERKLEQLSNKRRKEEFYRQWLELEPVAEVEDEEDREEGDSALSSAPSSLSPQPGGFGQWQGSGVTREAYEAVLVEIEELQSRLHAERQELSTARGQVRELERTLSQEAADGGGGREEVTCLTEKLRAAEEREANLLLELSELREQNELLEFRLLELEESAVRRDSPEQAADSGIVSPEPMHVGKERSTSERRNRAVATVIPYTTARPASPVPAKPPLALQESGIFEGEEEEEEEEEVEVASRGTQTEEPAGELLQEVQRLQELRARIQERAAKVSPPHAHPLDQSKICTSLETIGDVSMDSIVQLSSYQERVRELEERLERRDAEEEERLREKRLSKLREEELLDENYRLTERVYWLENELKRLAWSGLEAGRATTPSPSSIDTVDAEEPKRSSVAVQVSLDLLEADEQGAQRVGKTRTEVALRRGAAARRLAAKREEGSPTYCLGRRVESATEARTDARSASRIAIVRRIGEEMVEVAEVAEVAEEAKEEEWEEDAARTGRVWQGPPMPRAGEEEDSVAVLRCSESESESEKKTLNAYVFLRSHEPRISACPARCLFRHISADIASLIPSFGRLSAGHLLSVEMNVPPTAPPSPEFRSGEALKENEERRETEVRRRRGIRGRTSEENARLALLGAAKRRDQKRLVLEAPEEAPAPGEERRGAERSGGERRGEDLPLDVVRARPSPTLAREDTSSETRRNHFAFAIRACRRRAAGSERLCEQSLRNSSAEPWLYVQICTAHSGDPRPPTKLSWKPPSRFNRLFARAVASTASELASGPTCSAPPNEASLLPPSFLAPSSLLPPSVLPLPTLQPSCRPSAKTARSAKGACAPAGPKRARLPAFNTLLSRSLICTINRH